MASYKLTIKGGKEDIEFSDQDNITDITFKMNTLKDDVKSRDAAIRCEITIKGEINKKNKDLTRKLAAWSMDNDQKTLYRTVDIAVNDGRTFEEGDTLRTYKFSDMFVIDYSEIFLNPKHDTESTRGLFELYIAQKEGAAVGDVFAL